MIELSLTILAQSAPDMANDLWTAAKNAGPFATMLMFYMWWKADAERLRTRQEQDALLREAIGVMNNVAGAISAMQALLQGTKR